MNAKRVTDFTQGSIPRHLIAFSIPLFLGNLLQALYNTVDSIWVGRFLGPEALAAVVGQNMGPGGMTASKRSSAGVPCLPLPSPLP